MSVNCTSCLATAYSLSKYGDESPYPIAHLVLPFQLYFVVQNIWFTLLSVYIYESLTAVERAICYNAGGCLDNQFNPGADAHRCVGYIYDNMVADIHQGFLGAFLAMLFYTVFDVPRWMPSFRESIAHGLKNIWWKRLLFALALLSTSMLNYIDQYVGRHASVGIYAAANALVFMWFYFWNRQSREREVFWTGKSQFVNLEYLNLYIVGGSITTALLLSWFLPISVFSYINGGVVYGLIWFTLVLYGIAHNRFQHVLDLHSFGLYSAYQRNEKTRFRWNKDRYLSFARVEPRVMSAEAAYRQFLLNKQ